MMAGTPQAFQNRRPDAQKRPAALTAEEKEIVNNRELLENLDLLQGLDKFLYFDLFVEKGQKKDKQPAKPAAKKAREIKNENP